DGGTVAPRINEFDNYRVSAGFGVRFVLPMLGPVPIALDFGFPIHKAPGDVTQIVNFWMGFRAKIASPQRRQGNPCWRCGLAGWQRANELVSGTRFAASRVRLSSLLRGSEVSP